MLIFLLPLARNKENENIGNRILIGCGIMHYDTGLYPDGLKETTLTTPTTLGSLGF